jgi:hypothetical protein
MLIPMLDEALMQGAPQIGFENTSLGVRYRVVKDRPNGSRFVRHAECILPNAFLIPNIRETGKMPKRKERCTEHSWAVPIDNEHVTGLSIIAWPLEDGEPKKGWRPGTDTAQDIRPGSVLSRKHEDRQRKPEISRRGKASGPSPRMLSKTSQRRIAASPSCGGHCASRSSA